MSDIRCIGINTGGGDAPGLNAVIRAATKAAIIKYGWKVIGIPDGFDGLIWPEKSFELTLKEVSGILPRGGTILGTTNRGDPFHYKTVENGKEVSRDISGQVVANAAKLGIDAIITIGGDGSQKIGYELFQKGLKIVGVPKTIDNDLSATEVTFGFDTALHTVTDALDKIHTTAESHHRVMVVEVMGRDCGWIALEAGIAGGAHVILIPEIPFTIAHVCRYIAEREKAGKYFTIVVVAEGVKIAARAEGKPPRQSHRQPDRQRHRPRARKRSARQRAGAHPARRNAVAFRSHSGDALRRGRGRPDRCRRFRHDGRAARRVGRFRRCGPRHRPSQVSESQRRNRAHRPRHRHRVRGLKKLREN